MAREQLLQPERWIFLAATVMKLRRPEWDEHPSKPNSLKSATNQLTTLFAFRCDPR